MAMPAGLGMKFLAVWLILLGLTQIIGLAFQGLSIVMAVIALIAGILLLLGK